MKTLKTSLFISVALFAQTSIQAQVGDWPNTTTPVVGDWPNNPTNYSFFGTDGLSQTVSGNYALLQSKTGTVGRTYLNSPNEIHFRINNADKMVLANNGYFGIGTTTTPIAPLEVNGSAAFYSKSITMGPSTGDAGERVQLTYDGSVALGRLNGAPNVGLSFGTNNTNDRLLIHQNGQVYMSGFATFQSRSISIGQSSGESNERVYMQYSGAVAFARLNGSSGVGLSFGVNGGNDALVINQSGNVGIGTTLSGLQANQYGYKLAVKGTIGAQAVKVEVSSNVWSDYVFEKNYALKTIPELEAFINANKHLPNVPSAKEVEEKGIDMATMDATLLAKIEELSLYIIEQNKKLEAQNKRLEVLEKK